MNDKQYKKRQRRMRKNNRRKGVALDPAVLIIKKPPVIPISRDF